MRVKHYLASILLHARAALANPAWLHKLVRAHRGYIRHTYLKIRSGRCMMDAYEDIHYTVLQ